MHRAELRIAKAATSDSAEYYPVVVGLFLFCLFVFAMGECASTKVSRVVASADGRRAAGTDGRGRRWPRSGDDPSDARATGKGKRNVCVPGTGELVQLPAVEFAASLGRQQFGSSSAR